MVRLFIAFLLVVSFNAKAQISLVHINAEFNASNDWTEIYDITGAKRLNGYIDQKPGLKEGYNIRYVPTLILFKDGEEIERWEAGLDMKLHVTAKEIQSKIDAL